MKEKIKEYLTMALLFIAMLLGLLLVALIAGAASGELSELIKSMK